jgi:acyl dehydratase
MPGLYFEEFSVGQVFDHPIRRTITETDNVMVGISVNETTHGTTVANLGWDEVRFPKPLFHGDTIRVETEVLEVRESKSRPNNGIVVFAHRAFNQDDELVGECKRSALMLRKPQ